MRNAKNSVRSIAAVVLLIVLPPRGEGASDFVSLFNGRDLTGWKIPAGDNGHWRVVDGVVDYDAESEARGGKSPWAGRSLGDFILRGGWRNQRTPYRKS